MRKSFDDWGLGADFPFGMGFKGWGGGPRGRRRTQMFESGEMKFVILKLIREKPRHGYEVMKALEEKFRGHYTPSAGSVYPTLQLLEDEGFVKAVDTDGKKVYHITPEGEQYLDAHRDVLDEIFERVRETVRDFTGGGLGEVQGAFAHLAGTTFRRAWRLGPNDPSLKKVAEILKKAADEIDEVWRARAGDPA
jgi:DNA-binding PadR family transcriptional regulator